MEENHKRQERSSVIKQESRLRQQSTLSSFSITDQQHKDQDSFTNQISNNNKQRKKKK